MKPAFIGVDPGLFGAVAFVDFSNESAEIDDVPTFQVGKGRMVDYARLSSLLIDYGSSPAGVELGVVERVAANPTWGRSTCFKLGAAFGACCTAIAAAGIPYRLVTSPEWKRALKVSTDKEAARQIASQIMPWAAHWWPNKNHHNRAEAALIAYYAREISK